MPVPTRDLAAVRAAHVAMWERLEDRERRSGDARWHGAMAIGVWLVFHGWDGPTTACEAAFGMGGPVYRRFLDTLNDAGVRSELADAETLLFTSRTPIMGRPVKMEIAA